MEKNELLKYISNSREIVITTHKNPDGDAMGSSLGLYLYLKKLGKKVTVVTPTAYPEFLCWLPGNKDVLKYPGDREKAAKLIAESDIIFCLDFNNLDRIGEVAEAVRVSKAKKVMIDHHIDPDKFADCMISETKASSTAELVYNFIIDSGNKKTVDKEIATCLYTGIMTDTGSFRFSSVTADTHNVIAHLLQTGMKHTQVHEKIFDNNAVSRLKLLGYALSEKMVVLKKQRAAYISLTKEELKKFKYKHGDTEGLVNQPLSIKGVTLSALFTEKDNEIRLSFRSTGDFSVNDMARKYFNGGGHKNAAGGVSTLSIVEIIRKFEEVITKLR